MSEHKPKPRQLTARRDRMMARRTRDEQWAFADLVLKYGVAWLCWWDKARRHDDVAARPPNLAVHGLIDGMEMLDWLKAHESWWKIGRWSDVHYAAPVRLTDAGQAALAERAKYDMEPVSGGLVEPGWIAIPLPPGEPERRVQC